MVSYHSQARLHMIITIIFVFQESISVTRPSFYSERFQKFFMNSVFRKAPSREYPEFLFTYTRWCIVGWLLLHAGKNYPNHFSCYSHFICTLRGRGSLRVSKWPNFDPFLIAKFLQEFHKNSQSQTKSALC